MSNLNIGNAVYESPAAFREALFAKWEAQSKDRRNRKHQEQCPRCNRKNVNLYRHFLDYTDQPYGHWACRACWDEYKARITDKVVLDIAAELAAEANHAPRDMSGVCGAAYLDNFRKLLTGEWTDIQWTEWYSDHCGRCVYMQEECTKNWEEFLDANEEAAQIIRDVEAMYVSGNGDAEPRGVIELREVRG